MTVIVGDIVEARGSNPKKDKKVVKWCSKIKPGVHSLENASPLGHQLDATWDLLVLASGRGTWGSSLTVKTFWLPARKNIANPFKKGIDLVLFP